ncbi:MAG TPA: hypothetical protein PLF61_00295 [Candidatus Goldiibacteriota bacterium]|nr:hypothetical protein [Candidatus Goldiibacteriota bacterium]
MTDKIILLILFFLLLTSCPFFLTASGLNDFKQSDIYKENMFSDAGLKDAGILVLITSAKFENLTEKDKQKIIKDVLKEWGRTNKDKTVMVLIKQRLKNELWKVTNEEFVKIEESGIAKKERSDFFISGNISSDMTETSMNLFAGTYFFNNLLDASLFISVLGDSAQMGVSSRIHWFINQKFDFNAGIKSGIDLNNNLDTFFLIGINKYISYRNSLDVLASFSTTGSILFGVGLTYYEKYGQPVNDFNIGRDLSKDKTKVTEKTIRATHTNVATQSPTYTYTATATITETYTKQPTVTIAITHTVTEVKTEIIKSETTSTIIPTPTITIIIEKEKADKKKETKSGGIYIETDVLSVIKLFINDVYIKDFDLRFGFGGDFWGMNFWSDNLFYQNDVNNWGIKAMSLGLKTSFDFYPFLSSPTGFYIGPVAGIYINLIDQYQFSDSVEFITFSAGGETGYRLSLSDFIIDFGLEYSRNFNFYGFGTEDNGEIILRLQLGYFFRR